MSREIGRIVTDLPVELGLEEARTGRYDRRAVAQRFRELEFRSLIDRLPASSIAPTGYDSPESETKGGLQLSLDLLGGRPATPLPPTDGVPAARPDPLADPGGAIEHVDPRIARTTADFEELDAWLAARGDEIGLGWSVGGGRPHERRLHGIAFAAGDGSAWYVTCDPSASTRSRACRRIPPRGPRPHRSRPEAARDDAVDRSRPRAARVVRRHARGRLHGATPRSARRRSTTSPRSTSASSFPRGR